MRVAPTDISVMVSGESGTGKEIFQKSYTKCQHVNTDPILLLTVVLFEGTIDSELFGHEKGSLLERLQTEKATLK